MDRESVESKKLIPQVLDMLEAQGGKSLEIARKRLTAIKVTDPMARESLEMYARNWNDVIHPAVLSLSSGAVSEKTAVTTDLQVMVLFLTAAMDIHDDVMDKSTTKNGKTTLYGKFGEDLAILVGDALLMESLMMLPTFKESMDLQSFERIVASLKNSLLEVGNAHLMEIRLKKKSNFLAEEILDLINKKAAIFEGIAEIGAIAGKASDAQINALKTIARVFGYTIMIREEFIDMFEPEELSSRLKNEYPPLPIILALQDPTVLEYVKKLKTGRITNKKAQGLIDLVYESDRIVKLKKAMKNRANQATEILTSTIIKKDSVYPLILLVNAVLEDL